MAACEGVVCGFSGSESTGLSAGYGKRCELVRVSGHTMGTVQRQGRIAGRQQPRMAIAKTVQTMLMLRT